MSTIGFVTGYHEKKGTGSNGKPYTLYSFRLQSKEGETLPGYYQCGFDKPICKDGDYVKLEATPKDQNWTVNVASIKVSKNAPAAPAVTGPTTTAPTGGTTGPTPTQQAIQYQSSRKDAIYTVELLLANDALKLVKADTKAGAASRFDLITAAIDKLTVAFFNDVGSMRKLESVADIGVADLSGDGDLPDSEPEEEEDDFDNLAADEFGDDDGFE